MAVHYFMPLPPMTPEALKNLEFVNRAMMNKLEEYQVIADEAVKIPPVSIAQANEQLAKLAICNGYVKAVSDVIEISRALIERCTNPSKPS